MNPREGIKFHTGTLCISELTSGETCEGCFQTIGKAILFACISSVFYLYGSFLAVLSDLIRTGNISYELLRPKDMYFMWFFKILGQRLANVTLRFLPLIVVTIFLPKPYNLGAPDSLNAFILFIIAMFIGTLLITAISVFYPIVMLTTLNEKGIVNIIVVTADILSGIVVPVPFFPKRPIIFPLGIFKLTSFKIFLSP